MNTKISDDDTRSQVSRRMEKMMRGRAFSRIKNVFRRGRKRSSSESGCNDMIEASCRSSISTITMRSTNCTLAV